MHKRERTAYTRACNRIISLSFLVATATRVSATVASIQSTDRDTCVPSNSLRMISIVKSQRRTGVCVCAFVHCLCMWIDSTENSPRETWRKVTREKNRQIIYYSFAFYFVYSNRRCTSAVRRRECVCTSHAFGFDAVNHRPLARCRES